MYTGPASALEGDSYKYEPWQRRAKHTTDAKNRSLGTHGCPAERAELQGVDKRQNKVREEVSKRAVGLKEGQGGEVTTEPP